MNSRAILGTALALVWVFAMMTNPVLAVPPQLDISSAVHTEGTGCTITLNGPPGTATKGHDILVYVCLTVAPGSAQTVWLAAIHPSFNDDPAEQTPGNKKIHGHVATLFANNCVNTIATTPSASVSGNTVTILFGGGPSTVAAVIGYDIDAAGNICPTTVYSAL